jgi:hypothetical protein
MGRNQSDRADFPETGQQAGGTGDGDPEFELCFLDAGELNAVSWPLRGRGCGVDR